MIDSFRGLLFQDPDYKFSNVSKFLGEVAINPQMAGAQLSKIQDNLDSFASEIDNQSIDLSGMEDALRDLRYAISKIHDHLRAAQAGFTDKDACVFVQYMLFRYAELIKMAEGLDAEAEN